MARALDPRDGKYVGHATFAFCASSNDWQRSHKKIDQRMDVFWRERPYGARIDGAINGEPRMGALEYRYPNLMELLIDPPGRVFRLMAICLPQDDTTTKLILLTIRDFARWPILIQFFGS